MTNDPKRLAALRAAEIRARLQHAISNPPRTPLLPGALPPPPPVAQPAVLRAQKPRREAVRSEIEDISPAVYQQVARDLFRDGRTLNRVAPKKRRRHGMSLSCSQEEYELLVAHVDTLGVPFSQWARETLFRAIGRQVPARPKRR